MAAPFAVSGVLPPAQIEAFGETDVFVPSIVIVNVIGVPLHAPMTGVTVIVAVPTAGLNDGIGPDPLAARPMEGFEFVQLYVVPAAPPEKLIPVVGEPVQKL